MENLPHAAARRKLRAEKRGVRLCKVQPNLSIARRCSKKANKLIREHEDTLAGIEATDVVQRNNVLVFSVSFILTSRVYRRRRVRRYLTCLSTSPTSCQTSITGRLRPVETITRGPGLALALFTSAVSDRAATSAAEVDPALSAALPVKRSSISYAVDNAPRSPRVLSMSPQQQLIAGFNRIHQARQRLHPVPVLAGSYLPISSPYASDGRNP